ncbi:MAG: DUF5916 domain-containing protein, partial [Bacteroidota bacterium]
MYARLLLGMILCCWTGQAMGSSPHSLQAVRAEEGPAIDGKLDETCWRKEVEPVVFTQIRPANGKKSDFQSDVQIVYTDFAIYVGARLYDDTPDSIQTELGLRDERGRNVDEFAVAFDTYLKRQNAFVFLVTAAGVQVDYYLSPNNEDYNWNAIWRSAVNITETGWTVELEIPYGALRFPKQEVQSWGMNFMRMVRRNQEESYWHPVDANVNGLVNQFGTLEGLYNIKPPVRLQLIPYVSSYLLQEPGANGNVWSKNFAGGLDLKYGLNESFTLDMSLIPDFGQVLSDNIVLNLSPFEVRFDENRPFFTEGIELFNRGDLFYSRRVGGTRGLTGELRDGEEVIDRPNEAPLINAIKLSGRTNNGLGLGFFNAVTNETYAIAEDTSGSRREVLQNPLTNFNMVVLDQNLRNNSNIAFINTNVTRADGGRDANVTGGYVDLFDKTNTYALSSFVNVSQIWTTNEEGERVPDVGYSYRLRLAKVSGRVQYSASRLVESDNFDPNDLGFLQAANEVTHRGTISYQINEPFWKLNNMSIALNTVHTQLYEPRVYDRFRVSVVNNAEFRNFWRIRLEVGGSPVQVDDHFEARTGTQVFLRPPSGSSSFRVTTDARKKLQLRLNGGAWTRPEWNQVDNWVGFRPRFRFSNKFSLAHDMQLSWRRREIGYATRLFDDAGDLQQIIMGRRNVLTSTQVLTSQYSFNDLMGINLRIRHYWRTVAYDRFYSLQESGILSDTDYTLTNDEGIPRHDASFNAFNIDLVYTWQFAPGSTLSAVWKNAIFTNDPETAVG